MKGKFEDIIQKKFEGASSSVPSSAWAGVSSGMAGGAAGSVFSSVVIKGLIGLAVIGSVVTAVILTQPETETKAAVNSTEQLETPVNQHPSANSNKVLEKEEVKPEETNGFLPAQTNKSEELTSKNPAKPENTGQESLEKSQITVDKVTPSGSESLETEISVPQTEPEDEQARFSEEEPGVTIHESAPTSTNSDVDQADKTALPTEIKAAHSSRYSYSFTLNAPLSGEAKVKWYIDDVLSSESDQFSYDFSIPGKYSVLASIYKNGILEDTLIEIIIVQPEAVLQVPNTFTPNTSISLNDSFDIDHETSEYIEDYIIEIYSTSGELVFQSIGNDKAWNGQYNGSPAPEGVYTYKIIYWASDGAQKTELGNVVLQR
ncbi:MAG: gliding motility-associated C-terminal domain-containing protein [Flavobacteriales bacterium]